MTNFDPDNPDQELIHICQTYARRTLNPIFDWSTEEVWEFIHHYNIPYCKLYDQGYKRLGCIGCPMAGKHRVEEFERYPKYKKAYTSAFQRMIERQIADGTVIVGGVKKETKTHTKDGTIIANERTNEPVHGGRSSSTTEKNSSTNGTESRSRGFTVKSNGMDVLAWWLE